MRSVEGPFFKLMVTGPEASVHVKVKDCPAVTPLKAELVKETAWTTAREAAARRMLENCMLIDLSRDPSN